MKVEEYLWTFNMSDTDRLSGRFSFSRPVIFQAPAFGMAGGPAQAQILPDTVRFAIAIEQGDVAQAREGRVRRVSVVVARPDGDEGDRGPGRLEEGFAGRRGTPVVGDLEDLHPRDAALELPMPALGGGGQFQIPLRPQARRAR